jgi:tRNA pseudouridine13 synthase
MSDHADDSARPAKRARLDDNAPTLSSAPAPQPDTDLEREVRAGITEYVCPDNLGFTGVLKQRYTDFLVNEIGLDGRVLRLRSMAVPKRENGGEGKKEKANGGAAKQEAKEKVAVVVEEETGDVTMVDAQTEAVKTEDAPVKNDTVSKAESAQKPEAKEEEAKKDLEPEPEPEPEVGTTKAHVSSAMLTPSSSQKKIATHSTTYSAKTPRTK